MTNQEDAGYYAGLKAAQAAKQGDWARVTFHRNWARRAGVKIAYEEGYRNWTLANRRAVSI